MTFNKEVSVIVISLQLSQLLQNIQRDWRD